MESPSVYCRPLIDFMEVLVADKLQWFTDVSGTVGIGGIFQSKSRKFKYPTILWTLIPLHYIYDHYNDYKEKFNKTSQIPLAYSGRCPHCL